jgi:hypothetical protein
MGIAVALAVIERLEQTRRRVAQMQGHFQRAQSTRIFECRIEGPVNRIAFWGTSEINNRLGKRKLTFGAAETLLRLPGIQSDPQSAWIGIADIF